MFIILNQNKTIVFEYFEIKGGVAQMVSALVCHTKGRGFESPLSRNCIGIGICTNIYRIKNKKNMGLILALLECVQNV